MLPKISAYVKSHDGEIKWMYFFINDELLEKHNGIWNTLVIVLRKHLIVNQKSTIKNF